MGGEMVYILQQRLQAQKVPDDKAVKVLQDVVRAMYSPLFITELFKPQEMYTSNSTKQIFEKLAHSSIMRLNKQSMEKLYDLMIMGFKYQVIKCTSPFQVLQISLHHLEIMKSLVKSDVIEKSVQSAIDLSLNMYGSMSNSQWIILQQSLQNFYKARTLPYGVEKPGTVRFFSGGEIVSENKLDLEGYDNCHVVADMFDTSCQLGYNMYIPPEQNASTLALRFPSLEIANEEFSNRVCWNPDSPSKNSQGKGLMKSRHADMKSSAKQELNLLADLLGMGGADASGGAKGSDIKPFKINLFPDSSFDEKGSGSKSSSSSNFINIDIDGSAGAKSFDTYMSELKLEDTDSKAEGKDDDDDLLALMDSAAK
eukprot:CAMPEP_0114454432 /NCGR_PEP_ID=MMETSP0104-20121206/2581_1 /TAXON_ID=37642 ORGANISM="Paraphysomonas imperforata, Strain PA2" /NCGR_SAMPLE_ID=MMETSP0104 /ASSEMBLY_ACC=CAM_ASM_000202 /LENGTH=367 /DNA_ID=CAMNT_0001626821 /DNA_START=21 /DNA_END=1125 /DNA_ORIENTATION=-